jgi:uncharacterized membrane protein
MVRESVPWTDERVEKIVGRILQIGVMVAASVVLLGGIFYLGRYGSLSPHYDVFHGEPANLRSVSEILKSVVSFHTRGLIQFGVLLLIATPIARVAFSMIAFALQRDRTYVLVTLIVLGVLFYSLFGRSL